MRGPDMMRESSSTTFRTASCAYHDVRGGWQALSLCSCPAIHNKAVEEKRMAVAASNNNADNIHSRRFGMDATSLSPPPPPFPRVHTRSATSKDLRMIPSHRPHQIPRKGTKSHVAPRPPPPPHQLAFESQPPFRTETRRDACTCVHIILRTNLPCILRPRFVPEAPTGEIAAAAAAFALEPLLSSDRLASAAKACTAAVLLLDAAAAAA